ncbi:hypothetical protein KIL84_019325 [Mauremys mutica]|uniref:Short transmembrane mitochondrial protein 1 n=1 Tax=Mauremys mutica TaxID=74926 RepID=A0A9D3XW60_9SAUR|nr:hypothetical protein KIL84_019325 [Mauremys mutica]
MIRKDKQHYPTSQKASGGETAELQELSMSQHNRSPIPVGVSTIIELGFALGNVVGMYLAQNYDIPDLAKKLEDFKRDVEAKKKPPSDKS